MSNHIHVLTDIQLTTSSIVSIGMFDGVHLGHQQLVNRLVTEARASGRKSVVLTFFPHPDVVLKGVTGRYYLTSPETRARLLLDLGVDLVITHAFNQEVSRIRAADFVDQLNHHLKMAALWVGPDFALGYKREGNVPFLRQAGQERGFTVETIDLWLNDGGQVISSSRIREALLAGQAEQAARWLGRPYLVGGEVIHGNHRGRTIGFPPANISVWDEKLLPANGVYACWAEVGGERRMAVTNIGIQPTFEGDQMKVETHILDFEGDLYGQDLRVEFVRRLRPEQRFSGIDALVAQIQADVEASRALLSVLVSGQES
ncbi:MAG: bifunctional riboflavin kinase/FAD synthetase [Anaerolineae bacterium]|nr:bifunctional riboflavin kinase/FAD synthetase [Anaerolineae bacterium]